MGKSKIIEQLFRVITELDAIDSSSNSVIFEYHGIGWDDLCDIGIELFNQLKVSWGKIIWIESKLI